MDRGRNVLKHNHHPVAPDHSPSVIAMSVSPFMQDVEPQPGLIQLQRSGQIINNKKSVTLSNIPKGLGKSRI
jgi:hypothetical protein